MIKIARLTIRRSTIEDHEESVIAFMDRVDRNFVVKVFDTVFCFSYGEALIYDQKATMSKVVQLMRKDESANNVLCRSMGFSRKDMQMLSTTGAIQ